MPDCEDWEPVLRHGLHDLPAPPVSADFDARVLVALTQPQPLWRILWQQARPLLTGACCSLVVTLALAAWQPHTPSGPSPAAPSPAARPLDMTALDRLLDRPHLSAASLAAWATMAPAPVDRPRTSPRPAEHAAEPHCRASRTA